MQEDEHVVHDVVESMVGGSQAPGRTPDKTSVSTVQRFQSGRVGSIGLGRIAHPVGPDGHLIPFIVASPIVPSSGCELQPCEHDAGDRRHLVHLECAVGLKLRANEGHHDFATQP